MRRHTPRVTAVTIRDVGRLEAVVGWWLAKRWSDGNPRSGGQVMTRGAVVGATGTTAEPAIGPAIEVSMESTAVTGRDHGISGRDGSGSDEQVEMANRWK